MGQLYKHRTAATPTGTTERTDRETNTMTDCTVREAKEGKWAGIDEVSDCSWA